MKQLITILILLILSIPAISQEIMTVGDVFNFEIGDKFQSRGTSEGQPPNADRTTIIDKFYSINADTVFYIIYHDSYWTTIVYDDPPYLEYHFWTSTDTTAITNLDTYITDSFYWVPYDTSMYYYDTTIMYSALLCDSLINGYYYSTSDFEPNSFSKEYGRGLGLVSSMYHYNESKSRYTIYDEMFYYEKNGIGCGTPDLTVDIPEKQSELQINIFPNPTTEHFKIECDITEPLYLEIYDISGKIIDKKNISQNSTTYNCSSFLPGMYILAFKTKSDFYRKTLLVK